MLPPFPPPPRAIRARAGGTRRPPTDTTPTVRELLPPIFVCALLVLLPAGGCAGGGASAGGGGGATTRPGSSAKVKEAQRRGFDPRQVQSDLMAFTTRYIVATADVYTQVQGRVTTSEARLAALRGKLVAATNALDNAVEVNPVVGLMDMAVTVTLSRAIAQQPWSEELYGAESAAMIVSVLERQEHDVWELAGVYLTSDQIAELKTLCARWTVDHPDRRFAAGVSLDDLRPAEKAGGGGGGVPLLNSVFGLVMLDPFSGLDPAVKEVERSRVLAERMFFYLRHMPAMVSWQADALYLQMLDAPPAKRLLSDTAVVAASTTRVAESAATFADAGGRFADAGGRFAETIERFRVQLPDQQARLVEQLDAAVTAQRDAVLREATAQVAQQRDEAVKQLNAVAAAQQQLLAQHLGQVMDESIDRMYARTRSLVLISVGAVLAALVVYRLLIPRGRRARA